MKTLLLKKVLFVGCYLIAAILIELITFNVIGIGVFPSYAWIDLGILLFLSAIIFLIPNFIAQAIVICFLLAVQAVLGIVNEALYSMSNMVFSLNMLNLVNEVGGVFTNDFINFLLGGVLIAIVAVVGLIFWFSRKIRTKHTFKWQVVIMLLSVFILTSGGASIAYFTTVNSFTTATSTDELYIYKDDNYLYDTQFIGTKAYKKFGTFGYYYKNLDIFMDKTVSSKETISKEDAIKSVSDYFNAGKFNSDLSSINLTAFGGNDSLMTGKLNGQNIVLIVMESGEWFSINKEYTPTLYALAKDGISMTEYYARDKTNHSEAMSILGSYPSQIENTITPSISNSEGLLNNNFAFSLPNILQENKYTTNYFHASEGDFYGRNKTFAELYGFDYARFIDNSDRLQGHYSKEDFYDFDKDSEMISQYLGDYIKTDSTDSNFFSMMMTLISHGNYDDLLNLGDYTADLTAKQKETFSNKSIVKNMEAYYERVNGYPKTYIDEQFKLNVLENDEDGELTTEYLRYKRYQAGVMDLDVGLNRLINQINQKGELSKTSIILYSDHNCYYNQQNYFLKGIDTSTFWNTELYNVPFFIWSGNCMNLNVQSDLYDGLIYSNNNENFTSNYSGEFYYDLTHDCGVQSLGGIKVEKYCNSLDILPTILDLLGYDYNLNLYHGVSVFKDATSVFISRESGMFNANIYSDGNYVYVETLERETMNSPVFSFDKQICFDGNSIEIQTQDKKLIIDKDKAEDYLYYDESSGYIIYNLNEVLETPEEDIGAIDYRIYFSESVIEFLHKTNAYYQKQEKLELMYKFNYFEDKMIDGFVFKN